jgi:predicted ABC-class ATPase
LGADTLLIDEDTCATNFMIRDDKMMQLVAPDKEPITPFVNVVRSLYDDRGVSSVLVIGGVGDYFDVADNVIVMDCYKCLDMTEKAKQIVANAKDSTMLQTLSKSKPFKMIRSRSVVANRFHPNGKVKTLSKSNISYGDTELDISFVEQVITKSQASAISNAFQTLPNFTKPNQSLRETLVALESLIDKDGLDVLTPGQLNGGMSRPRLFEIGAAMNRLRRSKIIIQS